MAFLIPRLQYKNLDTTGNTAISNGTISSIPVTTAIEVGMFVRGTGIPTGALVLSKTSSSVTLASSVLATANGTGVTLGFGYEILFDYPPIEQSGELLDSKNTTSESLSGIQQISVNYIEAKRKVNFSFLSQTLYDAMDTFLKTSGLMGDYFRYFEDKTSSTYVTYELDSLKSDPKKIASRGVSNFVWEIALIFRRVI